MANLNIVGDDVAATRATFEGVRKQLGLVPNLFRVIANSPAGLQGHLGLSGALGRGVLPAALRERIALLIAETNGCDYCLSAHSVIGAGAGLSARSDRSGPHRRGRDREGPGGPLPRPRGAGPGRAAAPRSELAAARAAGWDDAAIVEIVLHVALNVLTNSVNNLAETPIDFPVRHTGPLRRGRGCRPPPPHPMQEYAAMGRHFAQIAFTPAVQAEQRQLGSQAHSPGSPRRGRTTAR